MCPRDDHNRLIYIARGDWKRSVGESLMTQRNSPVVNIYVFLRRSEKVDGEGRSSAITFRIRLELMMTNRRGQQEALFVSPVTSGKECLSLPLGGWFEINLCSVPPECCYLD